IQNNLPWAHANTTTAWEARWFSRSFAVAATSARGDRLLESLRGGHSVHSVRSVLLLLPAIRYFLYHLDAQDRLSHTHFITILERIGHAGGYSRPGFFSDRFATTKPLAVDIRAIEASQVG